MSLLPTTCLRRLVLLLQRMLAHRVAQYYGLQTSTVDFEEATVRVVGVRTAYIDAPRVRCSLGGSHQAPQKDCQQTGPPFKRHWLVLAGRVG